MKGSLDPMGLRVKVDIVLVGLEYTMKGPYSILGRREGYMTRGQARGYFLVRGSNNVLPYLELMM